MIAVGQSKALAVSSGSQEESPHTGSQAHTNGRNGAFDIVHCIINRHTCGNGTAGAIDIETDILFRIIGFQKQHLGNDQICYRVVNGTAKKNDTILQ